ncbi:restriction endonuclease subunit S [Acinetobacter variabilis]|uniref:restriction endonuclease subunit S n=1 Tax=Acinetobacter variabilis TaxID=70346 RepID=UPI00376FD506
MVPNGWKRVPIKEVCHSIIDCVNKTAPVVDYETPYKMIRTSNVRNGRVNTFDVRYVTKETYEQWTRRGAPLKGDVILTREAPVGEVGILENAEGIFLGQRLMMYRANKKIADNYYLFYSLSSAFCQKQIEDYSNGGTVAHMRVPDCGEILVNLPPLLEQQKIAQILLTWDQAISATEKLLENSQQQKKALMQQLLTGKKRLLDKGKSYSFITPKGYFQSKLGELPSDWKVELIKNHLWFQEGPGVRNYQFREEGMKLLNGTNIQFNQLKTENTDTYISEEEAFGIYKHFLIDEGDLLIACSGISIDRFDEKIAFVSSSHLPLCMNTSTMRFKTLDSGNVSIKYFKYFMQSPYFKNQIRRQATGSAQLNFGPSHVAQCYVVVPSYDEQLKIVSVLSNADNQIDTLQKKLDRFKQEKKALMQQLLTGKKRVKVAA